MYSMSRVHSMSDNILNSDLLLKYSLLELVLFYSDDQKCWKTNYVLQILL